jgi:dynein heavy chain 2
MVREAAAKGKWVCLKNLHLVTGWLANLEKELKLLEDKHENFKLFLTTEEHTSFPNILLETCFKVSYESPPGLKKNFMRTFQQLDNSGTGLKSKLVFLLAYFHALVQERKNYIPQGWSKAYEFSYSDLKVSLEIID